MEEGQEFPPTFPGFGKTIGLTPVSFGEGKCVVKVNVLKTHLNAGGVAHGGLHASILDTALGGALLSLISPDEWCATAEIIISYIRPAHEGMILTANGRVVKRGKNMAHMEGELKDSSGILIATAKGTWAIWGNHTRSV